MPPGVAGHVQAGDTQARAGPGHGHDRVQHGGGGFLRVRAVAAGLEADAVDRGVHLGLAEDLLELVGEVGVLAEVGRFAAEAAGLG
jgi:hypothetical protein